MSDIGDNFIFKKDSGEELEVNQKSIGLKTSKTNITTINFRTDWSEMEKIKEFFEGLKSNEPLKFDIGCTGDVDCYFKGISPMLEKKSPDGSLYFFISVTVQEIKTYLEEPEGTCNI